MIYRVRSGDIDTNVRAINHKTAAFIAVNKVRGNLGILVSVLQKGDRDDMEVTFSSAKILEDMQCQTWTIEDQN